MNYRDLKPGDVLINEQFNYLIISVKSKGADWITVHFVRCWSNEIVIYNDDYLNTSMLVDSLKKIV